MLGVSVRKFVANPSETVTTAELPLYDSGNVFIAVVDSASGNVPWGKVWIEYDVVFMNPVTPITGAGLYPQGMVYSADTSYVSSTINFFGATSQSYGDIYGFASPNTNTIEFAGLVPGQQYIFSLATYPCNNATSTMDVSLPQTTGTQMNYWYTSGITGLTEYAVWGVFSPVLASGGLVAIAFTTSVASGTPPTNGGPTWATISLDLSQIVPNRVKRNPREDQFNALRQRAERIQRKNPPPAKPSVDQVQTCEACGDAPWLRLDAVVPPQPPPIPIASAVAARPPFSLLRRMNA